MRTVLLATLLALILAPLLGAPPAAADAPPRPITKRLFRELVRGQHPLADVIDPARGVVVIDWPGDEWERVQPERAQHLCGDELGARLPLAMLDLRQALGWWREDEVLACTNRPSPSCTVGKDRIFRVAFRVDPERGLVLEAIVRIVGYRPLSDDERATRRRRAAAHVATARAAGCVATTPARPTVLTKRLLRELAWGLRPMADVIDPRRGLVRASQPNCASEDCVTAPPRHLCGAALDLEAIRRGLVGVVANEAMGSLACTNTPRRECVGSAMIDEWSNWDHVGFVDDPARGLVLESWIDLDESLTTAESQRAQRRWAQQLVDQARAAPCAP